MTYASAQSPQIRIVQSFFQSHQMAFYPPKPSQSRGISPQHLRFDLRISFSTKVFSRKAQDFNKLKGDFIEYGPMKQCDDWAWSSFVFWESYKYQDQTQPHLQKPIHGVQPHWSLSLNSTNDLLRAWPHLRLSQSVQDKAKSWLETLRVRFEAWDYVTWPLLVLSLIHISEPTRPY